MTHLVVVGRKVNTWAWGLEEALKLNSRGLDVTILDFGANKWPSSNARTQFQARVLKDTGIKVISWTSLLSRAEIREMSKNVRNVVNLIGESEEWIEFEFKGIPIGRILMSSYARIEGARSFPLNHMPTTMRMSVVKQVMLAYATVNKLELKIDQIIFSNGRGPIDATVLALARKMKLQCLALESGANSGKYFVYGNSPHYAPDWWDAIKKFSNSSNPDANKAAADKYWTKKLNGFDEISNKDWSIAFENGSLPRELPDNFITYFCTSEHEVPVFDDFEEPRPQFKNQLEAVKALAEICSEMNINLVIKRHPNSVSKNGVDNEKKMWEWAEQSNSILYLGPHSKHDTYALMKRSTAVITYKSSTGIEAAALGIPSISLGPAKWAYTELSRAESTQKITQFLQAPTCLDREQTQTWGAFMNSFGNDLTIFTEIKGGFALADGVKYFASEYYFHPWYKLFEKLRRNLVEIPRLVRSLGG